MKVRDRKIKETVDVLSKECLKLQCYWPRPDPGSYLAYTNNVWGFMRPAPNPGWKRGWICGTRQIRGCPDVREEKKP